MGMSKWEEFKKDRFRVQCRYADARKSMLRGTAFTRLATFFHILKAIYGTFKKKVDFLRSRARAVMVVVNCFKRVVRNLHSDRFGKDCLDMCNFDIRLLGRTLRCLSVKGSMTYFVARENAEQMMYSFLSATAWRYHYCEGV